jgi:hypothetical protein
LSPFDTEAELERKGWFLIEVEARREDTSRSEFEQNEPGADVLIKSEVNKPQQKILIEIILASYTVYHIQFQTVSR